MNHTDPNDIELLVLDVDGVLTDGSIIYDTEGCELKKFNVRDGSGMKYWTRAGRRLAIITGRTSEVTARRAAELDVEIVHQGQINKGPALQQVLEQAGVKAENAAYMGDDLPDIPAMRQCGLKITVCDAPDEVLALADWVSPVPGGSGAVRWAIEKMLKSGSDWDKLMERYR